MVKRVDETEAYQQGRQDHDMRGMAITAIILALGIAVGVWAANHMSAGCVDVFGLFKNCSVTWVR